MQAFPHFLENDFKPGLRRAAKNAVTIFHIAVYDNRLRWQKAYTTLVISLQLNLFDIVFVGLEGSTDSPFKAKNVVIHYLLVVDIIGREGNQKVNDLLLPVE